MRLSKSALGCWPQWINNGEEFGVGQSPGLLAITQTSWIILHMASLWASENLENPSTDYAARRGKIAGADNQPKNLCMCV